MEFVINKEDLSYGVGLVERIISSRTTLPVTANILFDAKKGELKLSANNLEIGMEVSLKAKIAKEGAVLIPAKTLGGIVSKLPTGEISFNLKERGIVNISYKKSNFNIHSLPPDEFPQISKVKEVKSLEVEAKILVEMLEQVVFAASTTEEKHVLNGILLETGKTPADDTTFRMVATDGYRLAKVGAKISSVGGALSVVVPSKAMSEVLKVFSQDQSSAKIVVGVDQISFKSENVHIVSRLIQGQFPDYKQVIPRSSDTKVNIDLISFLAAVERAAVIASQCANIVKIEVRGKQLHIMASAPDVGSVDEELEVEIKGKEKSLVAFNVRLVADALKVIDAEQITLELGESMSPGIIKPVEAKGLSSFVYIVMPIRTQEVSA
ncbi:DNA polymerase III subunit beta [candidate division WOR-1 bacterium RIFOXYD2_FULL_36_8]|uniref:Beta sliding clamp n=1 Tax=candidate division WOR-1 bacterium RIFOXYB2_FULL_36_35 TaxID=1802578 RepID=A0A1F4RYN4_UNCSA|nr:MAG: DNA polymerase III subunit beta [candidate division WOR-1 bacterium RIFOXYA2_FULL_36_21]OGC13292.1 MAG: DNA polymerase III subunit beta [candidate division WOR-1 bacterium RIFOXYB2_FULL_36_35]OGC16613.1 MAG: DNA polymerase III subunit beta [candidate division WOR-1 bacterium RIFOXYA12_FULL_36_13]OGC38986.1 MAG: DNA polymerase III subunit beta [candidate division WOR-1 bacterium RIFOXYD2_FULL_36_8]